MGQTFYDLTIEELCDLMCGGIEDDGEEQPEECDETDRISEGGITSGEGIPIGFEKKH